MLIATAINPTLEQTSEHARRFWRTTRVRRETAERKEMMDAVPRKQEFSGFIDRRRGYRLIAPGSIPALGGAIAHARRIRDEYDGTTAGITKAATKAAYNPTICMPRAYEDAQPFFDLALSDEVTQIACEYLGEIPILNQIRLWWTPVNQQLVGSQLFHRDQRSWTERRAKFIFNMDDVGPDCGPFTFLPADVSHRVSRGIGSPRARAPDELVFQFARPEDVISLAGPAGTGGALDTSRCYHFGARARGGRRLVLMFQFLRLCDRIEGHAIGQSRSFLHRYGADPVRRLMLHQAPAAKVSSDE